MKVVILAGGFGTRISEESAYKPKPMIEIGGMPILWHIMKTYAAYGFNEFVICAGYKQHVILWKEIRRCMDEGYDTFYCGGARGVDIVCGEIVIAEKLSKHPDIRLVCAIPYREQAEKWGWMWRTRYLDLLRAADKIEQMCSNYQRGCYHMRNRYMVDNCDLLIAIYNGENNGGTAYTVNYARERGKEILIIDPNTLEKTVIPAAYRKK